VGGQKTAFPEKSCLTGLGWLNDKMQIFVQLYGDLKKYAPGNHSKFELTLVPGATLGDVHGMLAIPEEGHVSLINGRRSEKNARFEAGDALVLLPPISGG
jgi:molybdopterin converting factor small subunit